MNKEHRVNSAEDGICIIVPVYNAEKVVEKLIRSVRRQTYRNWQMVLVSDGSKDHSGAILDRWAVREPRLTVIHQENQGCVRARSTGLFSEQSKKSKWICFCDADDILPRKALETLIAPTKNRELDMVCGDAARLVFGFMVHSRYVSPCFRSKTINYYDRTRIQNELLISFFGYTDLPVSLWAKLFRREVICEAYSHPLPLHFFGEDFSMTIQVVTAIESMAIVPDVVYGYRLGGGTSRFMPSMMEDCLCLYRYKKKLAQTTPIPQDYQTYMDVEMMNNLITWLKSCIFRGKWDKDAVLAEINRLMAVPEIVDSAVHVREKNGAVGQIARLLTAGDAESIYAYICELWAVAHKRTFRSVVKTCIKKLASL